MMVDAPVLVPGQDGTYQLCLTGKLYAETAPELESRIREAVDAGACRLVLDCAAVDQMDSSALSAIIAGLRYLMRKRRGCIVFAAINPNLDRVLTLTKMKQYFPITATVAEALVCAAPDGSKAGQS